MTCKHCGNQLAEGELLCSQCGKPVASDPVEEQPVAEPAVQETEAVAEIPVEEPEIEQPAAAEPQSAEPAKKPRKKISALLIAVIAVILSGAVAVGAFFEPIKGFAINTFGSDADYLRFVETKASDSATDEIAEFYGAYLENLKQDAAGKMSVKLNVGDKAVNLIESSLEGSGPTMDMDWLKDISVDVDFNMMDDVLQYVAALSLNGKELVNADLVMDLTKDEVFVGLPSLSDKYLKGKLNADEDFNTMMDFTSPDELKKALPSDKVVNELLDKYIAIVYSNLEDVEKSTEVLKAGELEQKVTALETVIDHETALNIAAEILETAEEDEELEKIIKEFAAYLEENEMIDNADEAYDTFRDSIADAIKELDEVKITDETVTVITYVNGVHEIVGRKIIPSDDEAVYYATVRDGADFVFEMEAGEVRITGEGTVKKKVINSKYKVNYEDKLACDITVTDLSVKKDAMSGKVCITPSNELLESMGMDSMGASVLSLASPELEFAFDYAKDTAKMDMNILSGKELFVGITYTVTAEDAVKVDVPNTRVTYESDKAEEWAQTLDLEALQKNLEAAGVPSELLQGLFG